MAHSELLENVRQVVQSRFIELGATAHSETGETILIRGGLYCGRRFDRDGFSATWFIAEGEIKFHDRSGAVVDVRRFSAEKKCSLPVAA